MQELVVKKIRLSSGLLKLTVSGGADKPEVTLRPACKTAPAFPIMAERAGKKNRETIWILTLQAGTLPLTRGDWEFSFLQPLGAKIRQSILLRGSSLVRESLLIFPMAGDGNRLILRVRPLTDYDTGAVRAKERLAFILAVLLRRIGIGRTARVIFEKFCAQAQDNGYAFFCYCMQQASPERKRHIYYILDRRMPAWKEVKAAWGRQVVPFMSLKHMLLMQLAPLYIASESRYHGYLWQTRPNPVFRDIRRGSHRILFLQHGVTALKRVEGVFGVHGYNPMTWFAVTSPGEQEIVTRYLGYTKEQAPILGFVRWDDLKDRSDPSRPMILMMPTWRAWLESADEETFRKSEYCQTYRSLLSYPELGDFLTRYGARLCFYIHPKLAGMLGSFARASRPGIELIPYGSRKLSDLIMECTCLVTDYSSVCWDACFLSRPVLFFQFDAQEYLACTGSYLDFRTELPGESARSIPELLSLLEKTAAGQWKESPRASSAVSRMLPLKDRGNAERTAAFIISQEGFL